MATYVEIEDGYRFNYKCQLAAGETSTPVFVPVECTVSVIPGAGGSMLAEASTSTPSDIKNGTATWFSWDAGAVTAKAQQSVTCVTAVRFTATTQPGVGEVAR
jgi:hypothetical protein